MAGPGMSGLAHSGPDASRHIRSGKPGSGRSESAASSPSPAASSPCRLAVPNWPARSAAGAPSPAAPCHAAISAAQTALPRPPASRANRASSALACAGVASRCPDPCSDSPNPRPDPGSRHAVTPSAGQGSETSATGPCGPMRPCISSPKWPFTRTTGSVWGGNRAKSPFGSRGFLVCRGRAARGFMRQGRAVVLRQAARSYGKAARRSSRHRPRAFLRRCAAGGKASWQRSS